MTPPDPTIEGEPDLLEERRASLVLDASLDAVVVLDEGGTIERWSPQAERLFGYSSDEATGRTLDALVFPEFADQARAFAESHFLDVPPDCEERRVELEARRKDGTRFPVEFAVSPIRSDGRIYFGAYLRDISDRRRWEAELQASMQLAEEANQTKSEFLANMSHEIRTPLHGILSFANFGLSRWEKADREKIREYFRVIHETGQTLLELVDRLLALSKLEAGRMQYEMAEHDPAKVMRGVLGELAALVSERNISIELDAPTAIEGFTFDEEKIRGVVRNLVGNAIKFAPAGSAIDCRVWEEASYFGLEVRDRGPGIPPRELESIFEKFVQSTETKTKAGGTGLGLAICYEVVRAHGGRIWAENHPDGGAVFTATLPRVPHEATVAESTTVTE